MPSSSADAGVTSQNHVRGIFAVEAFGVGAMYCRYLAISTIHASTGSLRIALDSSVNEMWEVSRQTLTFKLLAYSHLYGNLRDSSQSL